MGVALDGQVQQIGHRLPGAHGGRVTGRDDLAQRTHDLDVEQVRRMEAEPVLDHESRLWSARSDTRDRRTMRGLGRWLGGLAGKLERPLWGERE